MQPLRAQPAHRARKRLLRIRKPVAPASVADGIADDDGGRIGSRRRENRRLIAAAKVMQKVEQDDRPAGCDGRPRVAYFECRVIDDAAGYGHLALIVIDSADRRGETARAEIRGENADAAAEVE